MRAEPTLIWKGHTAWGLRAHLVLDTQGMETVELVSLIQASPSPSPGFHPFLPRPTLAAFPAGLYEAPAGVKAVVEQRAHNSSLVPGGGVAGPSPKGLLASQSDHWIPGRSSYST